uniref:Uncharacterized protein n=1 Tax=Anguilla anguilla TaxID=7936 RepID=A0A0E9V7S1_ANGAN
MQHVFWLTTYFIINKISKNSFILRIVVY